MFNRQPVHGIPDTPAQLARTGWFKRVHMKASATHIDRLIMKPARAVVWRFRELQTPYRLCFSVRGR